MTSCNNVPKQVIPWAAIVWCNFNHLFGKPFAKLWTSLEVGEGIELFDKLTQFRDRQYLGQLQHQGDWKQQSIDDSKQNYYEYQS